MIGWVFYKMIGRGDRWWTAGGSPVPAVKDQQVARKEAPKDFCWCTGAGQTYARQSARPDARESSSKWTCLYSLINP